MNFLTNVRMISHEFSICALFLYIYDSEYLWVIARSP